MSNTVFRSIEAPLPASAQLRPTISAVWRRLRNIIRAAQLARMNSVLRSMPDDILQEIGVSRDEVPAYARSLIYEAQPSAWKIPSNATSTELKKSKKAN